MKNRRAFTLIELLVVIAIIAILAAILFPVFAQAKLAAKKSSDLASVKQISLSATIYSGDVDDVAPTQNPDANGFPTPWYAGSGMDLGYMDPAIVQCWAAAIQPYIKSLQLPISVAAPKDPDPNFGFRNKAGAGNNTWAYNGNMMGLSMTAMSAPADLVMFQSKLTTTRESIVQPTIWDGANKFCNGVDLNWMGNTYSNKGGNYGWADGHASYKLRTAITFRNMGMSGIVHRNSQSGWADVANTQGLTDPSRNNNFWDTWGECKVENM